MNVIPFRRAEFSVYSFVEGDGRTIVERWFDENGLQATVWSEVYALWDFYRSYGPDSIRSSIFDLEEGFHGLSVPRSSGFCPVFKFGPFDELTEITFLAGARWDDRKKQLRPYSALGTAKENLEVLLADQRRRRRG